MRSIRASTSCLLLILLTNSAGAVDRTPIRVLFLGNSYTYAHNLPVMLEIMSQKGRVSRPIVATMKAHGAWMLQTHWNDAGTKKLIAEKKWDYVILQEQSQMPFMSPATTIKNGLLLGKAIQERKATPLLFMTWAREQQPQMQAKLAETYQRLGRELNAPVAPVGLAWEKFLQGPLKGKVKLHSRDGSHPSKEGSYLAACVFFAKIYKKSPVGLPGTLMKVEGNKRWIYTKFNPGTARVMQRTAWEVVQAENKKEIEKSDTKSKTSDKKN